LVDNGETCGEDGTRWLCLMMTMGQKSDGHWWWIETTWQHH